eukprot:807988_1
MAQSTIPDITSGSMYRVKQSTSLSTILLTTVLLTISLVIVGDCSELHLIPDASCSNSSSSELVPHLNEYPAFKEALFGIISTHNTFHTDNTCTSHRNSHLRCESSTHPSTISPIPFPSRFIEGSQDIHTFNTINCYGETMKRDRNEVYGDQDDYLAVKAHIDSTLVESVRRTHDHPFRLYLCDKCAQDIQVLRVNPNTIFKSIPSAPTSTQSTSNIRGLLEREHLLDALEDAKLSFQEDLAAPCVSRYSAARFGQNAIVELSKEDESCAAECAGIDGCMMPAADEAERALHAETEVNPPDAKTKTKVPKSAPMKEREASSQVPHPQAYAQPQTEQRVMALYASYKKHKTHQASYRIAYYSSATVFLLFNICWCLSSIIFIIYLNKQVKGFVVLTICMAFINCSGLNLSAGRYHSCALSNHNTAKCWGRNDGQLGYGDTNNRGDNGDEMGNDLPEVDLGTNFHVTQVVGCRQHTCAVSNLNSVKCWGYNFYGQLGYGDTNDRGDIHPEKSICWRCSVEKRLTKSD